MRKHCVTGQVTPEELTAGLEIYVRAHAEAEQRETTVQEIDDETAELAALINTPEMRAFDKLSEEFGEELARVILLRVVAFLAVSGDEKAHPSGWALDAFDETSLAQAMAEVASVMPLNPKGDFNRGVFFARVKQRVAAIAHERSIN